MSWIDWKQRAPPFFDDDGLFLSPVHAATHAVLVQGGMTDPQREAYRMIRDGGVLRERAEAWLAAEGLPLTPPSQYRS